MSQPKSSSLAHVAPARQVHRDHPRSSGLLSDMLAATAAVHLDRSVVVILGEEEAEAGALNAAVHASCTILCAAICTIFELSRAVKVSFDS